MTPYRFIYRFAHRARTVELGPYADAEEAKNAFQRVYGYWPADALSETLWTTSGAA